MTRYQLQGIGAGQVNASECSLRQAEATHEILAPRADGGQSATKPFSFRTTVALQASGAFRYWAVQLPTAFSRSRFTSHKAMEGSSMQLPGSRWQKFIVPAD